MNEKGKQSRCFGFEKFRFAVAGILLFAAGLKAYQLATAPLPPVVQGSMFTPLLEWLNDRHFLMAVVVGEILFALVLIAGLWRQWTWLLSLIGFSAFTLVSMMKGLSGEASCGCFGTVTVNPWITAVLDLVIVAFLIVLRERLHFRWALSSADCKKLVAVLVAWLVIGGLSLSAMLSLKQQPHATLGTEFTGINGTVTVFLEPETWVGERLPLWDYVDDRSRATLEKGEWNIVIARKQCEDCKKLIAKLNSQSTIPLAILELDDDSTDMEHSGSKMGVPLKGKLKTSSHWVILTPCLVKCRDGICVSVETTPSLN
jgi:hypothetical protein